MPSGILSGRAARRLGVLVLACASLLINNMDLSRNPAVQKYGHFDFREYDAIAGANVKGPLRVIEALMDNVAASRRDHGPALLAVPGGHPDLQHAATRFERAGQRGCRAHHQLDQ